VSFDWPTGAPQNASDRLRSEYVPALAAHSVDPMGAGDALLAVASLTLAAGGTLQAAALLGSMAASIEVQSLGNVPVSIDRLADAIAQRDYEPAAARMAG
jgi:bifunctional ADP-heptose synthase (sugar kinase/adenylyltransferase)